MAGVTELVGQSDDVVAAHVAIFSRVVGAVKVMAPVWSLAARNLVEILEKCPISVPICLMLILLRLDLT